MRKVSTTINLNEDVVKKAKDLGINISAVAEIGIINYIIELENLFKGIKFKHTKLAEYKPIAEMLEKAKKEKREGIMVKDLNGKYESEEKIFGRS